MNTHKTLRMGALGTLVAVAVLTGCGRDEPDTASSTVITPSSPSAPAGSSSSSTVTPGTSGYVGPGDSTSTSPSTSGSDTSTPPSSSSSSSTSGSAGGPGMSSSDQPSTSPGTSGYVGGSSSGSASDSGTSGSTAGSDTDDMRNRSGSGSSSGSSGDTSSGTSGSGGTTGNPVGPNSSLDAADRPFRDVAVRGAPDVGAAWREAMGVRMIRVADTQGDARKSGSGSAGMGATPTNTDKMSKKDKKFIEKAAAGGMFEVEAARLASEKASDPQVKAFAAKLMDHHQQANQELKQLADARGVMLPTKLPSKEQAMIDKLSKAEGDKFDKEFLKTVGLRDHKEDIRTFENAQNETSDAELKSWIAKTLPTLRTHLAEAQSMSGSGPKMQGYTGSSSAQPSDASPTGSGQSGTTGSATDPASQGPTGTGVGGSLGGSGSSGSGAGGGSGGGAAGGAAGGN